MNVLSSVKRLFAPAILGLALVACGDPSSPVPEETLEVQPLAQQADSSSKDLLEKVLSEQPESVQARYPYRNPGKTLEFFGVKPGMTVVEALPGGGWYSNILMPYLGSSGALIGADYSLSMYANFSFYSDALAKRKATWVSDWTQQQQEKHPQAAKTDAFVFNDMPERLNGAADVVLFIRALHNLARFQDKDTYLEQALSDAYRVLKPGGVLGVVQHWGADEMPDQWALGQNGYLKKQFVIDRITAAGFELQAESDINANPLDRPGVADSVWRLPPSLRASKDDPNLRERLVNIGESNRMTLRFVKPVNSDVKGAAIAESR